MEAGRPPTGQFRPPGQVPGGQRPGPPPQFRPPPGGPGPMHHQPPKIIQQSTHIRDLTPQKLLTEADCLSQLTTYSRYSIRKLPALSAREKTSWARAEVTEDHLDQSDIKKQIRRLNDKGKSVVEKQAGLARNQQGQVTALLDELASKEPDINFEWSLAQMHLHQKDVPGSRYGKKAIETVVMDLYVKRAPRPGLNAIMMFQNIEKRRMDSLRPPPPPPPPLPQHHQQGPPPPPQIINMRPSSAHGMRKGEPGPIRVDNRGPPRKQRDKKYHHDKDDSSSTESSDLSDSESDSGSEVSSSLDTSVSSESRSNKHRQRRNSRVAVRSHSRHRPKYHIDSRRTSPEPRLSDAYGVPRHSQQHSSPQRPYVPDVPRAVNELDAVASAYRAGHQDAKAELEGFHSAQPVIIERIIERPPIERVIEQPRIERIIESPRAVVSYSKRIPERLPETRFIDTRPRFREPQYHDDRLSDGRSYDDDLLMRKRELEDERILRDDRERNRVRVAEEYISSTGRRPSDRLPGEFLGRRQSYSPRGESPPAMSPTREYFDTRRRPNEPRAEFRSRPEMRRVFTNPVPHPFAQNLPRRYPSSTSSANFSEPGW